MFFGPRKGNVRNRITLYRFLDIQCSALLVRFSLDCSRALRSFCGAPNGSSSVTLFLRVLMSAAGFGHLAFTTTDGALLAYHKAGVLRLWKSTVSDMELQVCTLAPGDINCEATRSAWYIPALNLARCFTLCGVISDAASSRLVHCLLIDARFTLVSKHITR